MRGSGPSLPRLAPEARIASPSALGVPLAHEEGLPLDVIVKAKCEVPARVRQEARRRLEHAARFLPSLAAVEVIFGCEPNPRIAEPACVDLSARTQGGRIRVQGRGSDHRAALDVAVTRFERQLARSTARATARTRRRRARPTMAGAVFPAPPVSAARTERPPAPRFVRHSRFSPAAMLPDEAAAQLELLGQDVLVFTNRATGAYSVVYRHREGGLVLLEPELQVQNGSG
jgi:ribosomal subunit interface protein